MSIPTVTGILLLDLEGKRIAAKYYTSAYSRNIEKCLLYEKKLYGKTGHQNTGGSLVTSVKIDTVLIDGILAVYTSLGDATLYVLVNEMENELIGLSVLNAIFDTLCRILSSLSKRAILDQLDLVFITIDEAVDDGLILETDSSALTSRVSLRTADGRPGSMSAADVPLSEQTFSQAFQTAKEQLVRSFR